MVIGVVELELWIPHNRSLKGKRSVVNKVVERAKSRFNVTVAEVGKQDIHSRAVLGFAMVGSDPRYVNGALDKLLDFVASLSVAEVVEERIEVIQF